MSDKSDKSKIKLNVIFVCTGNTCRSPMAEFLFKDYLRDKKRIERGAGSGQRRRHDAAGGRGAYCARH